MHKSTNIRVLVKNYHNQFIIRNIHILIGFDIYNGLYYSIMLDFNQFSSLPLLMLYAEIHFRFFPLFPSLLYKKEPEILFDAPARLKPGHDLPVALIVNDIKLFPIELADVSIAVSHKDNPPKLFNFCNLNNYELDHSFKNNTRVFIFIISRENIPEGNIFINCRVSITKPKKRKTVTVLNDNLTTSSKFPFKCFAASNSLPGNNLCEYGDLHVHSIFSRSHVEFGPPLQLIDLFADAMGLKFIGITDHSYDLACSETNYLVQDQSLSLWKRLSEEFSRTTFKTILLQGEEISCLNDNGEIVHLCGLGLNRFITGTLDGARRNSVFNQQLTIDQTIKEIHDQGGVAFAAHPGSKSGLLQRVFLHRGTWAQHDITGNLDGFQALNSGYFTSWNKAKSLWIKALQQGKRIPLLGGNDAHGDFNRYRAILSPFISIYENSQRFMGAGKTGTYGKMKSQQDILDGIRNGASFVTTGPYISINFSSNPNTQAISSKSISSEVEILYIHAVSTSEFGRLRQIVVYSGAPGSENESLILLTDYAQSCYEVIIPLRTNSVKKPGYIRVEIKTLSPQNCIYQAFSSACYFD